MVLPPTKSVKANNPEDSPPKEVIDKTPVRKDPNTQKSTKPKFHMNLQVRTKHNLHSKWGLLTDLIINR